MPTIIGIYKITCIANGKFYVGSSRNCIDLRWRKHKHHLNRNNHHSPNMQNSWNKYGKDAFIFEVLEECSKEKCLEREQFYIDTLKPIFNGYPLATSPKGYKHKDSTKKKMSLVRKGKSLKQPTCAEGRKPKQIFDKFKKPIVAYDLKNNQSYYFADLLTAEKYGYNRGEVLRHMNGRRQSYRKLVWEFISCQRL